MNQNMPMPQHQMGGSQGMQNPYPRPQESPKNMNYSSGNPGFQYPGQGMQQKLEMDSIVL
jgi:hypothetical protein